jgi:hypothetical protein
MPAGAPHARDVQASDPPSPVGGVKTRLSLRDTSRVTCHTSECIASHRIAGSCIASQRSAAAHTRSASPCAFPPAGVAVAVVSEMAATQPSPVTRAVAALDALVYASSTSTTQAAQQGGGAPGGDVACSQGVGYLSPDFGGSAEVGTHLCWSKNTTTRFATPHMHRADTPRVACTRRQPMGHCPQTASPTSAACAPSARGCGLVAHPAATRWLQPATGGAAWVESQTCWPATSRAVTRAPRCCCRRRWNPLPWLRCVVSASDTHEARLADCVRLLWCRPPLHLCRSCRTRTETSARGRCASHVLCCVQPKCMLFT